MSERKATIKEKADEAQKRLDNERSIEVRKARAGRSSSAMITRVRSTFGLLQVNFWETARPTQRSGALYRAM